MADGRDITRVLIIFMFISMAFMLISHSSRTRFLSRETEAEETETMKKEKVVMMRRVGYGGWVVEVQGRQVPTGPDPLHHKDKPNTTP